MPCHHQADFPFYLRPNVWFGDLQTEYSVVLHDTEYPYWNQMSLNNTKLKLFIVVTFVLSLSKGCDSQMLQLN